MKTPAFLEPIVQAIWTISITEALDAIDREYAKVPDGWQPIETAPKDGTNVILFDGTRVSQGGWISEADQGAEPGEEYLIAAGWWSVDLIDNAPTHWLPLPAPPVPLDDEARG